MLGPETQTETEIHHLTPEHHKPREECGVWAIWDEASDRVLEDIFIGAQRVEHRGEEGTGVACIAPGSPDIELLRGEGRVAKVFGENGEELKRLPSEAFAAVVQTRYGTDNGEGNGTQPRVSPYERPLLALAHNGQITNGPELAHQYGIPKYTTDSDLVTRIIYQVAESYNGDVERAVAQVLPDLRGAFCLAILTADKLIAARDHNGIRPFQLGRSETGGYIFSSEAKAITDIPGANWEREIEPGEMIVVSSGGLRSGRWAEADPAACLLEFFYLANKETVINGHHVGDVRQKLGELLWQEYKSKVINREKETTGEDLQDRIAAGGLAAYLKRMAKTALEKLRPKPETIVVPIPNGGNQAAHGFARAGGLRMVKAFEKNEEYGRSFIQPNDEARVKVAFEKLRLVAKLVKGKRVVAIDDTKIRGTVGAVNNDKLRKAGVRQIVEAIAAPPFVDTCQLGVDIGSREELIAVQHGGDTAAIAKEQGADSTVYLPLEPVVKLLGGKVCTKCLGGPGPDLTPAIRKDSKELITASA